MSDHKHYAIVFDVPKDHPDEPDDADTHVEVYHDRDEAYDRWTELSALGYGVLAIAGAERQTVPERAVS